MVKKLNLSAYNLKAASSCHVQTFPDFPRSFSTNETKDIVNNERINAEHALNQAITTMVKRHAAMWEAHAELHQLSIRRTRNKTAKCFSIGVVGRSALLLGATG
jgi:hypothetical protein